MTRLDPETLDVVHEPLRLPEGSMGRIAADLVDGTGLAADGRIEHVYVPGAEHLWRLVVEPDRLTIDDWRPRYRTPGDDYGLSWDACLSDGSCWILDCGDVVSVRRIHGVEPNGRFPEAPGRALSWRQPAPWTGAQRLVRVSLSDPDQVSAIEPFGTAGGGVIAPPVHVPEAGMAVAWDSINGGLAGIDTTGRDLQMVWHLDVRPSMQPVVFPESGELAINDFTDAGTDDVIVVDLATGSLLDRVDTGSRIGNGMFLSPDDHRGLFYCTTLTVARISWA